MPDISGTLSTWFFFNKLKCFVKLQFQLRKTVKESFQICFVIACLYWSLDTILAVLQPAQKAGLHMKGFAPSLDIMGQYKVCLAPLRFGAGLKGKIVDSWWHGLPVNYKP